VVPTDSQSYRLSSNLPPSYTSLAGHKRKQPSARGWSLALTLCSETEMDYKLGLLFNHLEIINYLTNQPEPAGYSDSGRLTGVKWGDGLRL